jgi:hypothetical protein
MILIDNQIVSRAFLRESIPGKRIDNRMDVALRKWR